MIRTPSTPALAASLILFLLAGPRLCDRVLAASPGRTDYTRDIRPLLSTYCFECHGNGRKKGNLALDRFSSTQELLEDKRTWTAVLENLQGHIMPPRDGDQPKASERNRITRWIQTEVLHCDDGPPDPGRTTLRRLNRTEYNNTIRDLVGVDFHPADDFPADDTGYGFDNIGDVLSLPPVLFERYLNAAESITDRAIVVDPKPGQALPEPHRRIFSPAGSTTNHVHAATRVLGRFAARAYRRVVTSEEVGRLVKIQQDAEQGGEGFEASIKVAIQAVLVSPHFLFHGERSGSGTAAGGIKPLDDFALASRLSYFLWSTMPDEELFDLAGKGRLRRSLSSQVKRMLRDPKSRALVDNFAGQWLQLRKVDESEPDHAKFPAFDPALRAAMRRETELFFEGVMREDRSVLEFLDSDYTYANVRLARHYGIEPPQGRPFDAEAFQRISLRGTPRGGLLTQGSILTLTSNPQRTSPVKRGRWILDNILGTPAPPPPGNVPELTEVKLQGTLRQRVEKHRENPLCASCHERMDPIGFGFENFDAVGAWREQDDGFPVEPGGTLISGESFRTAAELRQVLVQRKRQEFLRCLSGKMLTYALGRGMDVQDRCTIDAMVKAVEQNRHRFSAVILAVVDSVPFQFQRAEP